MLSHLNIDHVYDSSHCHLVNELFCPLLSESVIYKRGVGYFTSGWLREAVQGLAKFAENGGRAFIVTSPHIEKSDWDAFVLADEASRSAQVYETLKRHVDDLEVTLREDTRNALAWLVADGIVTFKFAVPKNRIGDYHDKFAVFEDAAGDKVAIHGSYNDSIHGLSNGESFSVFCSWNPGQDGYVQSHGQRFDALWSGRNDFFHMYDMSEAIKHEICRLRNTSSRPYTEPDRPQPKAIRVPSNVQLYDFQQKGIDNWFSNGCRGLFEMATGTGKTFTSLAAAVRAHGERGSLLIIVAAPFNHLVDQWNEEAKKFGFVPLLCRDSATSWLQLAKSRIQDFNNGGRDSLVLITTHKTASASNFIKVVSKARGYTLLIADEVHYLGSRHLKNALLESYQYRIGLSATPDRWFDETGSQEIRGYFGKTVAEMPLEVAIGTFLTPYRFIPHLVTLSDSEFNKYTQLTRLIRQLMASAEKSIDTEYLQSVLRKRANIVSKAAAKLPMLLDLLNKQIAQQGGESVRHCIVYVAPGEADKYVRALSNIGLRVHSFIHTVPNDERLALLDQFNNGHIQLLVAIKCLDEGVNIPATKEAYFVASTSNPREFVQRRGRILRKHPGKERAIVHDFVVTCPRRSISDGMVDIAVTLLRKEMPRFVEFSSAAENEFEARDVVFQTLLYYNALELLELRPWDVYRSTQDKEQEEETYE
ncbi:MAG: type III restriction protein res subunit [Bacillota bacterium]|nr:MAG: type III restriction protein res subunit [Bacillota bacterium]